MKVIAPIILIVCFLIFAAANIIYVPGDTEDPVFLTPELESRVTELEENELPAETVKLLEQLDEINRELIELKERLIELRKMQIMKLEGRLWEA